MSTRGRRWRRSRAYSSALSLGGNVRRSTRKSSANSAADLSGKGDCVLGRLVRSVVLTLLIEQGGEPGRDDGLVESRVYRVLTKSIGKFFDQGQPVHCPIADVSTPEKQIVSREGKISLEPAGCAP